MTIVLVAVIAAALLALITGARPATWRGLGLRGTAWLVLALAVQVGALALPDESRIQTGALVLSLVLAGICLARNLRVPGLGLVLLGIALNALVVALNRGMPVSLDAAVRAGAPVDARTLALDPRHVELGDGTLLPLLGDVVPVPLPLLPEVVSVGDLLVALGLAVAVLVAAHGGGQPARRRRRLTRGRMAAPR